SHHQSFSLLHNHCNENPAFFLKSNDFTMIEKSIFISILERDDLKLEEIDVWDYVIKWGIGQNEELKKDISEWKKEDFIKLNNITYEFKLILSRTQDGFSRSVFEDKCYNIKQTMVVIKIKETGELVGGYNPVCWNIKEKSLNEIYWIETDKSFIFKIDKDEIN